MEHTFSIELTERQIYVIAEAFGSLMMDLSRISPWWSPEFSDARDKMEGEISEIKAILDRALAR